MTGRKMSAKNCVVLVFLLNWNYLGAQVTISGCSEAISGGFCQLTCSTPDYSQSVEFQKNSDVQGGCSSVGVCGSAFGYVPYRSSEVSETYLNFSSLSYGGEDATWRCAFGSTIFSNNIEIRVRTIPTNITWTPDPTSNLTQTLSVQAHCVYPNDVEMVLVYEDGCQEYALGEFNTSYSDQGISGCDAHEYQVNGTYQLSESALSGKSVRFKVNISVSGLSLQQESDLTVAQFVFPGEPTPVSSPSTTNMASTTPDLPLSEEELIKIVLPIAVVFGSGVLLVPIIAICCYRKKTKKEQIVGKQVKYSSKNKTDDVE